MQKRFTKCTKTVQALRALKVIKKSLFWGFFKSNWTTWDNREMVCEAYYSGHFSATFSQSRCCWIVRSLVWNFCSRCSDVISREKTVCSGVAKCRLFSQANIGYNFGTFRYTNNGYYHTKHDLRYYQKLTGKVFLQLRFFTHCLA